jgi:uncharacterized membrane protein
MKRNVKFYTSIIWLILGSILVGLSFAGKVDEFWNGMGSALLIVGIINLLRIHRLHKNKAYREQFEIEINDERNHFIRNKAWSWSGYLFVMIAAISCIVFKIIGQDILSLASSGAVCLMLVLYWISYIILKKKY